MNAVNLLAMMFAAQDAAASLPQQSDAPPVESGIFWLLQQQALADGGFFTGSGAEQRSAAALEASALLIAAPLGSQVIPVPDAAQQTGNDPTATVPAWSLSALLEALVDGLRQILNSGMARSTAPLSSTESWNSVSVADKTAIPTSIEGQSVNAGDRTEFNSGLIAVWNRVIAQLNSRLTSQFQGTLTASSTPLNLVRPELARPAMPWTLALQTKTGLQSVMASQAADEPAGYPLTAAPDLLAELPASVRWFQSLGLIGTPSVSRQDRAVPVPLSARLELPGGSQAVVRLSQLTAAAQGSQQQRYTVSIELPGDSATVLTATLTIQHLVPQPSQALPGLMPITVAETAQPVALIAGSPLIDEPAPQPVAVQAPDSVSTSGPQMQLQSGDAASLPLAGKPSELLPAETEGYVVSEELLRGLKSAPVLKGKVPAVEVQTTLRQSGQQPNRTSWTVQMALDELNGVRQEPTILDLHHADDRQRVQFPSAFGKQLGADQLQNVAAPTSPDLAAAQLMEFVGTRFETAQYAGLEYLELAQRIMERVNAARSAGNGLYNAHLDLNPPNLGKMFVNISVRGDAVALQIAVASTVPKEQLKDSLEALRQSLEEEGLYVVELQVHEVDGDEQGSNSQRQSGGERDDSGTQSGETVVKTTPSIDGARKSTPALGFYG